MHSAEIRQSFLHFFAGRDHLVLPSSSLIPDNDPSVLLTTAGMQQFKPYYAGLAEPPARRVATVQKVFRTVDLEEVGDQSHLTFFEMLGNFAFGDYFKEEAIEMAWEYLTRELSMDPARLWPSAFPEDEASAATWRRVTGRDPYPLKANFWPENLEGWVGPCGPDSEIFYDMGAGVGCGRADCHPGHCERYVEIWNLVFPQYNRQPDGAMPLLEPPGIDTGMGLERLAMVLAGFDTVHQTDVLAALNDHFRERTQREGPAHEAQGYARRLLSDHGRGTTFLLADGVRPGNEGRGYVLRRMIRRATLHGVRRLGIDNGLSGAVDVVCDLMGDAYPAVRARRAEIVHVLEVEEAGFRRTLEQGEALFNDVVRRSDRVISGDDAFRLHDTFGFPIELTSELAAEQGLKVDREGFEVALSEARQRSRRGARRVAIPRSGLPRTEFTGYESLTGGGRVLRIFKDDAAVERATEGDDVEVYLDRTPMYAESGGQVGDTGVIEGPGATLDVRDVQKQGEAFGHYARVTEGTLAVGDEVRIEVDAAARWASMRHHSATHLVHRALREVLGEGATQAGSYVAPDTCTFDFSLDRPVTPAELDTIFRIVNRSVRSDLARETRVMSLEQARQSGAMQLFGEKYGDEVRVVSFGDFSVELCGGTHVDRTGQIGHAVAVSERSVGTGVRRLEFLAGEAAERRERALAGVAEQAALALKVSPSDLPGRVSALVEERRQLQKQLDQLRRKMTLGNAGDFDPVVDLGIVFAAVDSDDAQVLREAADRALDSLAGSVAALVLGRTAAGGRVVVKTRGDSGISAADIFKTAAGVAGGRGGGDVRMAQGGGFPVDKYDAIRQAVADYMRSSRS